MGDSRATGDGRRATGDGRRATVLLAARSAVALYRLLDTLPALSGDDRITRLFTLVPGSEFGADALAAIEEAGGRTVPWDEACARSYDLILTASPKGDLHLLRGKHVLLPHGAGYNKSIPGEGGSDSASGLDPVYLSRAEPDAAPIVLHAVAHPDQVTRLAAVDPRAADRATVVGDPTLERLLASRALRDSYRAALGTGPRRLVVLVSTWGPESLLRRNPDLPARLAAELPYDEYQLALVVHPNEHSRLGRYELAERLAPALGAGLVLAGPREEWASVLIAADALITDHGSSALYYCAVEDRPVISAGGGGAELIPGSPMDSLLSRVPRLAGAEALAETLAAYRPGTGREAARAAFAHQGRALHRLRTELYALLGLTPPARSSPARLLPAPRPPDRVPTAFDVDAEITAEGVRIARRPAHLGPPGHHLAVEHGAASERLARSAGLLYRRPLPTPPGRAALSWTSDGWARHALSAYPGCRTAVAVLPSGLCLLRTRGLARAYVFQVEPRGEGGRVARADPAAAASAVHAWLLDQRSRPARSQSAAPTRLTCVIGGRAFGVLLRPATSEEAVESF
ncbi:translation initiation factor 2 [Streptomyces sp. NPDC018693]|uniref:translation initiation factor 2 n=1 Tax=unclassified Streptomyces TaxID=2593676 RepID=UPI0037A25F78